MAERRTNSRSGYITVQTHLPNIAVRVEKGSELGVTPDFLPVLLQDVRAYHDIYQVSKEAEDGREALRGKIIQTLWELPHLRGLEERDKKRVLDFIPEREVSWDIPLLRKNLGPLAGRIIKESPEIELLIPSQGLSTPRGTILTILEIRQAFVQALMQKGINREDAEKVIKLNRKTYVDEETLQRLEQAGNIKIPEGVKTEKIVNWRLTPYQLR